MCRHNAEKCRPSLDKADKGHGLVPSAIRRIVTNAPSTTEGLPVVVAAAGGGEARHVAGRSVSHVGVPRALTGREVFAIELGSRFPVRETKRGLDSCERCVSASQRP